MKILTVNCYCDGNTFSDYFSSLKIKPEVSIQKYFNLFLRGLSSNGADVDVISERQISYKESGLFYKGYSVTEGNINIKYIPIFAIPVLYQFTFFFHALFYTIYYFIKKGKPDYVICDIMRFYSSFPTLIIGKLFGVKVIGYVADIPQMYHHQTSLKQPFYKRILKSIYSITSIYYDGYILLSDYMNEHVNTKGRPYIVIEGIVDDDIYLKQNEGKNEKGGIKAYMYAGGLYEKYGVKMLIEAFKTKPLMDLELWLFGKGELEGYINENADERIKFFGYQENEFVVQKQREASFLINPRPTNEDFTKYSFPSKIMEYMVSGTPVISTKIKSIPAGYWDYIIPIETESIEGIKEVLNKTSKLSEFECERIGRLSRDFVLKNKNGLTQGNKVIQWLQDSFK